MKQVMTGARFVAETLKAYGVTSVFFMEAILRQVLMEMEALGIKRVLTHSEKTAAYMADGYARASRRPGVCMAQSVGAANQAAGLQEPFLGRSPVVAISGRKALIAQYRNPYQEILHGPLFEPMTKYHANIDTIEQLPYLLRQAFREATSGTPGPAHLDFLGHQGNIPEEMQAELEVIAEEPFSRIPAMRPAPEMEAVREAVRLLAKAERPVIVSGGGAAVSGAGPEIARLAEMLSIPVATSLNGKETVLESHPLNVGVVGRYSRWCTNKIVAEADMVFYVGSGTGDHVTAGWRVPRPGTPVIQVDINPSELGRSYPNLVSLMGDAKVTLQQMIAAAKPRVSTSVWAQQAQRTVQDWRAELDPLRNSQGRPIRVERLCRELTECLPANAILVADTGYAAIWTSTMVYLTSPGQSGTCAAPDRLGGPSPPLSGPNAGAPTSRSSASPETAVCGTT